MSMINKIDKNFLYTTIILAFFGFLIFFSAAMGDLIEESVFRKNIIKQGIVLVLGFFALFAIANSKKINSKSLRKSSIIIFSITFLAEFLVFVPGIGRNINGASR
jgi:cell division protein FtsW (lipid II flippase)